MKFNAFLGYWTIINASSVLFTALINTGEHDIMWQYELQYSGSQVNRSHLFESIQENYYLQLKLHILNHNCFI